MSEDKRLGANPLAWVAQTPPADMEGSPFTKEQAAPDPPETPERAETPERENASREPQGAGITAPHTIHQEELMGKGKVKIKQTMDTAQVAAHLEDLASSLVAGVIRIESGEDAVILCSGDIVKFEMKVSRKKDKAKCSIEMEWTDDGSKAEALKITA